MWTSSSFLSATVVGVRFDHFNVVNIHQESRYLYVESRHFGCDEVNISNHPRPSRRSQIEHVENTSCSQVTCPIDQVVLAGLEG